jgi:predicted DCC family thiol-disulfide oxidoreductase YuxK
MDEYSTGRALMLYDGLCGFCNGTVQWVLRRDGGDRIRFAPQQSALAEAALDRHGIERADVMADNSVYLLLDYGSARERLLRRSDVTVHVLLLLGGGWGLMGRVLQAVPRPIRDGVYNLVARNRFRFAGRYESCPLPSPAQRMKFLS